MFNFGTGPGLAFNRPVNERLFWTPNLSLRFTLSLPYFIVSNMNGHAAGPFTQQHFLFASS